MTNHEDNVTENFIVFGVVALFRFESSRPKDEQEEG
jgi:hypothetical protein